MQQDMIETKRLEIRPLTYNELEKYYKSPNDFAKDLGLIPSRSLIDEETKDAILNDLLPNLIDPSKNPLFYTMWIVIEKNNRAIIGGICFHGEPDINGEVEIGYGIDVEYRNCGIMTETINALIKWISENRQVRMIKAVTDIDNVSSIRVLEKNDFKICERTDKEVILKLGLLH